MSDNDDEKVEVQLDLTEEEWDQFQIDAVMQGMTPDEFIVWLAREFRKNPWPLDAVGGKDQTE